METHENKLKIGIVAYDNVSNDDNRYLKAFRSYYEQTNFYFEVAWPSVDALMEHIRSQGSATLNELHRIIIFDSAFPNNLLTTKIVNKFVSLEELMENRNVNKPILSFPTTNQQVFDLFKLDKSPEGHDLFVYPKTRINRIKLDKSGQFNMGELNKLLKGELDENALAIRNDYEGREAVARKVVEDFRKDKLNQEAAEIDKLTEEANSHKSKQPIRLKKDKTKALIEDLKKQNQEKMKEQERIDKESIEKENARLHATDEIVDVQKEKDKNIKDQLSDSIKQLRSKSLGLNFDSKIYNDKGVVLFGGTQGSGVSGIVANLAMYYAMSDRRVLLVNMSSNDHVTRYFEDFIPKYNELGRSKVMMTKFAKRIQEIAIPVAKNIELVSDYGIVQKSYSNNELFMNYDKIIRLASKYDITMILAGNNFEDIFMRSNKEYINDVVLVSSLEDLNEIDIDLINDLKKFNIKMKHLDHRIGLIINKIQYYQNDKDLNKKILKMHQPFDRSRLLGYFDYDPEWFIQLESGCPIVARSNKVQRYCNQIAKNLILKDTE